MVGPDPRAGPRTAQEHHGAGPTSPHGLRLQHLLQQEPRPLDQAEGRLPDRRAQVGAGRRRRHPRELQGQDVGRVQDKGRRERWGDDREGGGWRVQRQGSKSEVRRRMERVVHGMENNGGRWGKGQNGKGKM